MARLPRLSVAGWPHLVLQRGHNGELALIDEADAQVWHTALHQAARDHAVAVHAYGLWRRGFLLVATPSDAAALGRLMQSLGRRYAAHFNRRHGRSGTLWDGRFRATVIEPKAYLLDAMQWVESPAGHGAVSAAVAPELPGWSSAAHYLGQRRDAVITEPAAWWALGNTPFEREGAWLDRQSQTPPPAASQAFVDAVQKGWALGSPGFLAELAQQTGRRTTPLPRGRPRKAGVRAGSPPAGGGIKGP
jgi:putative transposase